MDDKLFKLYKHLPVMWQNFLCSSYGYKLNRMRYGKEYQEYFDFLLSSEHWNAQKILQYKEEQLDKIIHYAYRHCPYYKMRFRREGLTPQDFKGLDSLKKFPVLTKDEVRANYLGMISEEYDKKKLIPNHTSGSTGKALDFYWSKENLQFYWATVWRGRHRFGIHRGDIHLNFTGKLVVPLEQKNPPYWRFNRSLNQYMLNMQHITKEKMPAFIDFLNKTEYKFAVGYPSIMHSFAVIADELGMKIKNAPAYIFSSAEKMYENQKQAIMHLFPETMIVEHYGFSENAASASKCSKMIYHEDYELGHLELKNPILTPEGTYGSLLATGFRNLGMPFIRYEIGDKAIFSNQPCGCGLHSQAIVDIEGRNEDYIITPEGAHIMRMDYLFKDKYTIKECQVIQREQGSIIIRIVRRKGYNTRMEESVRQAVNNLISPSLKVTFEYVDRIPRTQAGKFRAVVSELKNREC